MATGGLDGISDLANDKGFRERVRAAMYVAARDIGAEGGTDDRNIIRRGFAAQVAQSGDEVVDGFAWMVAANPAIRENSDDDDIQFTVNSVWDACCGAGPA
jgi:hypothetical protein